MRLFPTKLHQPVEKGRSETAKHETLVFQKKPDLPRQQDPHLKEHASSPVMFGEELFFQVAPTTETRLPKSR